MTSVLWFSPVHISKFEYCFLLLIYYSFWCMDDMHMNFRCSVFLSLLWEWKHRQTLTFLPLTAEVRKILFVENLVWQREEKNYILGNIGGPINRWSLGPGWGVNFIAYFCIAWGWRCLSDANKHFLGRRSVSLTSCHLSLSLPSQWSC
jgi:hypothetical protein